MTDSDIQGTVTNSLGNAVTDAIVYLWKEDSPNKVIQTTTDSNGDYIFDGHPDGDGTSDEWHVSAYYTDPDGKLINTLSKPKVSASLPESSVIPDGAIHQYPTDEGSGSTLFDDIGSADGTINGPNWVTGNYKGGYALERSGSGQVESLDMTYLQSAGNITGPWSVAFTIETTDNLVAIGASNGGAESALIIGPDGLYGSAFNDSASLGIQASNGDNITVEGNTVINDGNKYRVGISINGNAASDVNIFVNGSDDGLNVVRDQSPSSFNNIPPFSLFAENQNGSAARSGDATIDNVIVADQKWGSAEFSDDYNNQPWS